MTKNNGSGGLACLVLIAAAILALAAIVITAMHYGLFDQGQVLTAASPAH